MKTFKWIMILFLILGLESIYSQVFYKVVAKDGTGNYSTIKAALNSVPNNSSTRILIFVKKGVYNEKVDLASTKINVSLIGENADSVIITYDDNASDGTPAANTYTFFAEANDFYAENITFENSSGDAGQAIAIRTIGERQVFKNCKFLGFQDTYYAHKNRQYNLNCTVSGATDFIYGDATAVFENCTVKCKSGGQYITAPSDTKLLSTIGSTTFYHGLLFIECDVFAESGVSYNSYYLGRPWQPGGSSVYINCRLGPHIRPEGWSVNSGTDHLTGCYAEYRSRDTASVILDVSSRVDWSKQLSASEVNDYYSLAYFFKKNDVEWNPVPITESLDVPTGLSTDNKTLSWTAVDSAKGYIVYKNDEVFQITDTSTLSDTTMVTGDTYFVKSVSKNGNLSDASDVFTGINEHYKFNPDIKIYIANNELYISEKADIEIYSVSGILTGKYKNVNQVSVLNYQPGIYIARVTTQQGMVMTTKFYIH